MKKSSLWSLLIFALALTTITACGGGSSSGGGGGATQPTSAVVTLATTTTGAGIPANTIIAGYDITITLPAGVTVKSSTPPQTDAGVVAAVGAAAGSSITGNYTPAVGSNPGKVRILIAKGAGFNTGQFATLVCDIAAGSNPQASDFNISLPNFSASGFDTSNGGSTVSLTGVLTPAKTVVFN